MEVIELISLKVAPSTLGKVIWKSVLTRATLFGKHPDYCMN